MAPKCVSLPDPLSKKLFKRNTKMHAFLYFAKKLAKLEDQLCLYGRSVLAQSYILHRSWKTYFDTF
ncbi:MAG TPA: hypothetical protein DHV51_04900 [Opitutae bacterium]|nr:hypothetical protein [Opitutae bacterium]